MKIEGPKQTPWQQLAKEGMKQKQIIQKLGLDDTRECPDCPPGTRRVSLERLATKELSTPDPESED